MKPRKTRPSTRSLPALAGMAALLLGIAGCSQTPRSEVPLVPASGKVTLDGKPLPEADIEFIPEGDTRGQGGSARTNADGGYLAATPFGEAGLSSGIYKVVISKRELPKGMAPPAEEVPPAYSPYQE